MARTAYATIILLGLLAGTVLLQIFLSKRESKWPGLVLPVITFLYSVLMMLNVTATETARAVIAALLSAFIMGNIPTLILLAIYFVCREKRHTRSEVDKMRISDL
jgi:predicted permease